MLIAPHLEPRKIQKMPFEVFVCIYNLGLNTARILPSSLLIERFWLRIYGGILVARSFSLLKNCFLLVAMYALQDLILFTARDVNE